MSTRSALERQVAHAPETRPSAHVGGVGRTCLHWALLVGLCVFACARSVPAQPLPQGIPQSQSGADHIHPGTGETSAAEWDASGTAWLPRTLPTHGAHRHVGAWEVMLHGNLFVQYLREFAPEHRGGDQVGSINWIMGAARRSIGRDRVGVRAMMSLEPATIGGCGYPDLLATGELCGGDNIHDRQHPHDVFMELALEYDRPLAEGLRWQIYGGPAGEPALGPVAFPHRPSAMANPVAPISHHWLDSTHVTFGVLTTGIYTGRWKAEASVFNGREPDEQRTDMDLARLDSASVRVWFLPSERLALQVSAGHLIDAERAHLRASPVDVSRVTASGTHHHAARAGRSWMTTVAWGTNLEQGQWTHAALIESSLDFGQRQALFGRMEINGKQAHDLHIHESPGVVFTVAKVQGGYTHYLAPSAGLQGGVGASASAAIVPPALQPRYGGVGLGLGVFVTVRSAGGRTTLKAQGTRRTAQL